MVSRVAIPHSEVLEALLVFLESLVKVLDWESGVRYVLFRDFLLRVPKLNLNWFVEDHGVHFAVYAREIVLNWLHIHVIVNSEVIFECRVVVLGLLKAQFSIQLINFVGFSVSDVKQFATFNNKSFGTLLCFLICHLIWSLVEPLNT